MGRLLTDICRIQYGYPFDSAKFSESDGIPLVRIRDVVRGFSETKTNESFPEQYTVYDGDILIGMDGEFNIAKWSGGKAALNQRVCKLIPDDVNRDYIFYFMPIALKAIEAKTPFVTVKHLSAKELNKIVVPLPDIEKQEAIASTLSKVDHLISLRKQQLAKLDELIKARFVEMFGEPDEFPREPLKDNVFEMFIGPFGSALKNDCFVEQEDGYCIVYEQKHAIQKTMDVPTRYVDEKKYRELKRFSVYPGDIIVSCRGTIGEVFIVPESAPLGIMHPSIMKIRLNTEKYDQRFFVLALEQYMGEHNNDANGSGVKMAVTATTLGKELFVVPPIDVQKLFSAFIEQVDKSKAVVQQSLDKLETLKSALMQEYFG